MISALFSLLIKLEALKTEDLKKVKAWVDYNLEKRETNHNNTSNCSNQSHT